MNRTNTLLDGEVTGENPDAGGDFYLVGDHNRDMAYNHAKVVEALKHTSGAKTDFQIIYGGVVSDSGSGQIDISAGVAIGKDADGNLKIIEIPALTNIALPSGWNDGRQIWVIGEHKYVITGSTRNHDETSEAYHYIAADSYKGSSVTNDLFVDANPTGNYVIWGSFKMATTTYTAMADRSQLWFGQNGVPGIITGGLKFNTASTPPTVSSGTYEADGIAHFFATDQTLSLAGNSFGKSKITFDTYQWYFNIINKNTGALHYIHAFDTSSKLLNTITITQIVVSSGGTVAVFSTGTTTGLSAAANNGHDIVIKGWTYPIIGRVTAVVASTSFTMSVSGLVDGTYGSLSGVSFDAFYRIQTLHGGSTSITVDAAVTKFTPSPVYCDELQGYYLDANGVPTTSAASAVYKTLGTFYSGSAGTILAGDVISYKSGADKNDNYIGAILISSTRVGEVFRFTISSLFNFIRGNGFTATDDGTNAFRITANQNLSGVATIGFSSNASGAYFSTSVYNSAGTLIDIVIVHEATGYNKSSSLPFKLPKGGYITFSGSGTVADLIGMHLEFRED